jgi:hypothetical protein
LRNFGKSAALADQGSKPCAGEYVCTMVTPIYKNDPAESAEAVSRASTRVSILVSGVEGEAA